MDKKSQEMFARLLALSKIQEARVKANPIPYLDQMAADVVRLETAIEAAMFELSGASSFDIASEKFPDRHPSLVETVTVRNRRAHDILANAIRPTPEASE